MALRRDCVELGERPGSRHASVRDTASVSCALSTSISLSFKVRRTPENDATARQGHRSISPRQGQLRQRFQQVNKEVFKARSIGRADEALGMFDTEDKDRDTLQTFACYCRTRHCDSVSRFGQA